MFEFIDLLMFSMKELFDWLEVLTYCASFVACVSIINRC